MTAPEPWLKPGAQPHLRLVNVRKSFGDVTAVDDLSLDIYPAEFFALLGPSGCGKTTVLRMLAGFEAPESGQILLDGEDLTQIPPYERPVNMMFQSYALFPHMSVERNIAFGLQMEGMGRAAVANRVAEMLSLTHLEPFARRKPAQLSGGQRQRVALARALAKKPKLLLLDEPLGALDRKLREATQFELVNIQEELGLTFVIVTHDQEEAMTVSTRLAVMRDGKIAQMGTPRDVYETPASRYVAEFIGDVNILSGQVSGSDGDTVSLSFGPAARPAGSLAAGKGDPVEFALRPEKMEIALVEDQAVPETNAALGKIEDIAYLGNTSIFHVRVDADTVIRAERTNRRREVEREITWDDKVLLTWAPQSLIELRG
ncbi:MAG: ABC transporter ATP-binding protein [Pseudomonadota bacterium]